MSARILQINANYGFGSTGLIMKDIDGVIASQSDMQSFVAYQRTNVAKTNGTYIGNPLDWKLHALLCRLHGRQGYYSYNSTKRFIRQLDALNPDIVHLHNLHSNYINIKLLLEYLAQKDIRTVITMHDCWWFTGKCFHYVDVGCEKFMTGCDNCPKKNYPPVSYLGDYSAEVYASKKELLLSIPNLTMVGCSDWICEEAKKSFLKNSNIKRIYNGVDTEVFSPKKHCKGRNIQILGMANKWLNPRNIGIIKKIIEKTNATIKIVGCTEVQKEKLKEYSDKVEAIGFISNRNQLADIYNSADVFINLTHADTLPTVNMESICCGTPVITYDVAGSPELVEPKTGFVVKEDNQDQIINIISAGKLPDRQICASVGKCLFDKDSCYNRYIDLYRSIL